MKTRFLLPLSVLSLLLCLFAIPALAEAWPTSREELAAANLTGRCYYDENTPGDAREEWAKLWARRNYGEDIAVLSTKRVATKTPADVDVRRLIDGYRWLSLSTWEISFRSESLIEGLALSDGAYTVSTQVVCLEGQYVYPSSPSTLVGFIPPKETFHDLHEIRAYLHEDPRFAESLADLRTTVPAGMTEIDLRKILGDDALGISNAWMMNENVCVLLRSPLEDGEKELIWLNLQDLSILSRTPVPYEGFFAGQGWEDGTLCLLFEPDGQDFYSHEYYYTYDPEITYIKAIVAQDGTVSFDGASSKLTLMPGGDTAIREGHYGSLYSVDMDTGEERLLIQGTAGPYGIVSYEAYLKYVPFRDDEGFYEEDANGNLISLPFPQDEESYPMYGAYHGFSMYKPLDEYRFVYVGYGWEWGTGFGIYDLQTNTDHRITGRESFFGMVGNTLYGSILSADANTFASSTLPQPVQDEFERVVDSWWGGSVADYDISPDGMLLALLDTQSMREGSAAGSEAHTVTITDIQRGDLVKTFDIDNPFATESTVSFYDDTRLMLFYRPEDLGSAYIYLFDIAEGPL